MLNRVSHAQWSEVSDLIATRIGLHFPPERRQDLERGITGAALELGFADTAQCVDALLSAPFTKAQLQVLASHLTIGETYFFRDPQILKAVADQVLPELIRRRRGRGRRLRIWSAASCSGEEAYSLAILLHQHLPDLADWKVTITATDVNPRFLGKAIAGVYREWSFRNAPPGLRQRYFTRTADGGYAIIPEIRKHVTFSYLNLVEDAYPSLLNDTNAMDLIFCRNVLMYFTPAQIARVVHKLEHALADGGWLVVSPSETSQALFGAFTPVNYPGAILYRKGAAVERPEPSWTAGALIGSSGWTPPDPGVLPARAGHGSVRAVATPPFGAEPSVADSRQATCVLAESLYAEGRYGEAADTLLAAMTEREPEAAEFPLLARALANQGRLDDALRWCDRWIALDKVNPAGHYLRAVVRLEQGDTAQAQGSLRRALYLCPEFVLAHFALGNLARARGHGAESARHFANARALLCNHEPDALLPESDGLTAGRLSEIITATITMESLQ